MRAIPRSIGAASSLIRRLLKKWRDLSVDQVIEKYSIGLRVE